MKKLIRLFIAIFCIFFVLQAMPGSFIPALRSFLKRSAQSVSDTVQELAGQDGRGQGSSGQTGPGDKAADDTGFGPEGGTDAGEENAVTADASSDSPAQDRTTAASSDSAEQDRTAAASPDSAGQAQTGDPDSSSEETSSGDPDDDEDRSGDVFYYYYTKISKEERLLYDAMLALTRNPESGLGAEESRLLSIDPSTDEFAQSYTRAYNALVTDHPELFWVAQERAKFECRYYLLPSFGGQYKVVLSLTDGEEQTGSDGDTTPRSLYDMYSAEEAELEAAADAMLARVDLTQSQAKIALDLHDLLLDYAWYNVGAGSSDYAHSAYGALVADSSGSPGGALCDGYALAYEYLLQKAGLTCTMVCGYAGASEDNTEKHAWNLVQLDGDWYEVDATWDDLDFALSPSDEGYDLLMEALSDEEYMRGIRHYMFNRTTEEMRSFTPGDEYTYSSYNGWVTLLQPSVHIRFTSEESEWTRDFITPLAPRAEGTWYTWETVAGL